MQDDQTPEGGDTRAPTYRCEARATTEVSRDELLLMAHALERVEADGLAALLDDAGREVFAQGLAVAHRLR